MKVEISRYRSAALYRENDSLGSETTPSCELVRGVNAAIGVALRDAAEAKKKRTRQEEETDELIFAGT